MQPGSCQPRQALATQLQLDTRAPPPYYLAMVKLNSSLMGGFLALTDYSLLPVQ